MPTYEGSFRARHDNDAEFRSVHEFIHNRILDMGFDNPTVSGQIDFTTVLRPGFANVEAGFRVYAFTDVLQATTPIFFRVGYSTGFGVERPRTLWQFGFGYDNFGNIITSGSSAEVTGSSRIFSDSMQLDVNASTATPQSHSWSGDGSRLAAAIWYTGASQDMLAVLERTKDENGDDDARGVIGIFGSSTFQGASVLYIQSGSSNERHTIMAHVSRPVAGAVSSSFGNVRQVSVVRIPATFGVETSHNIIRVSDTDFSNSQNNTPTIFVPLKGELMPFKVHPVQLGTTAFFLGNQQVRIGLRFQE